MAYAYLNNITVDSFPFCDLYLCFRLFITPWCGVGDRDRLNEFHTASISGSLFYLFFFCLFFAVVAKAQISLFPFAENKMNISSISTIFPSLPACQPLFPFFVRHFLIVDEKTEYLFYIIKFIYSIFHFVYACVIYSLANYLSKIVFYNK